MLVFVTAVWALFHRWLARSLLLMIVFHSPCGAHTGVANAAYCGTVAGGADCGGVFKRL
jgi:hypothetical protein